MQKVVFLQFGFIGEKSHYRQLECWMFDGQCSSMDPMWIYKWKWMTEFWIIIMHIRRQKHFHVNKHFYGRHFLSFFLFRRELLMGESNCFKKNAFDYCVASQMMWNSVVNNQRNRQINLMISHNGLLSMLYAQC